ncbi:MAG TPA: DUF4143 domain-containing protein, partial [Gemmatimonadales bacterium]|nr:DUF4143 domain-containing protein [Gemmatimonadales bacterium]
RYLGLLEASFVLNRLTPYLQSRAARLIKSPKILMTDSGLTAHLASVSDLGVTAGEPLRGALFETYVGQNLLALLGSHLPKARLHFWSIQGRYEVDFVITTGRSSIGIEVKASSRFSEKELGGLQAFLASTPGARAGILAYNGTEALAVGKDLYAIPLGMLLS